MPLTSLPLLQPLVSLRATLPDEPACIGHTVYVLTARHLQRWWVAEAEHMDSQVDLERMARDSLLQQHLWVSRPSGLGVWLGGRRLGVYWSVCVRV